MRNVRKINEDWIFTKEKEEITVNLPHTWNNIDGQDGGNDYYRGMCTYRKYIAKPDIEPGEQVYLEFRGVNSSADIVVNDIEVGHHDGGYSTFRVNITKALKEQNEILVKADNSRCRTVYPQKADFTFYGGIYRDVYLITVPQSHFALDYFGSDGLKVTPKIVGEDAEVSVESYVIGKADKVRFTLDTGAVIECDVEEGAAGGQLGIPEVHLWNGRKDPYLYTIKAELIVDGDIVDTVQTRFGCRTFSFDSENGFFLNGKAYPLRGVSKHQDRQGVGNAVTKDMLREDMDIIADMGANTIRLAHYQHDQYFYDLCDEYGMAVWAEIPYISEHMEEAASNAQSQLQELIVQNYNHPSIVCWGLSNEITITKMSEELVENHRRLNSLAHELDATRPTAMAHVIMLDIHDPILEIPDIHSYNLYFGWYFGSLTDNEKWFDDFHKTHPDKIIGLSEYGADASIKWQIGKPEQSDYTEQYQCVYHEHLLKVIEERPYIWATHVWNMFDFGADGREEGGEKGLNQKGLVTFDRKVCKDAYYLYKAYLSENPFVHICGRRYVDRPEAKTEIKVYSNQSQVTLYDNGNIVGVKEGYRVFSFKIDLTGQHTIEAVAGKCKDKIMIRKAEVPNPDYRLPNSGIHNWFDEPGMEFPAGYLSIKDTMGDIHAIPEGARIVDAFIAEAAKKRGDVAKEIESNELMDQMMNRTTLESLLKQAGESASTEAVIALNQKLNKIRKM